MRDSGDQKLKEILRAGSYVSTEDLERAAVHADEEHVSLPDYLLREGLITKDLLGQAIAEAWQVPYADLNSNEPPHEQILKIPETIAKQYHAVLFHEDAEKVTIATDFPGDDNLVAAITRLFPNKKLILAFSLPDDIVPLFTHYQKPLETRFTEIFSRNKGVAPEILDAIITDAYNLRTSDIHFEPQRREVAIRFRVDGVMREVGRIPKEYFDNLLNRIKVQSRLRLDEHNAAQDGSMRFEINGTAVDLRTSIVPTIEGEKVVLRLLAAYVETLGMADLGLSPDHQRLLEEASKKPYGMILVTGPTGSGKTTTLYALLKILNSKEVNITTIEDPVEYKILGINQIQVNPLTNLTFAKGLRSIVRQDPDIILVGEIRDAETAEIAVNAALTGHLVLSTFHANDAATAIPRLLDMEIEPFLLASMLQLVIAQRLVRRVCDNCKHSVETTIKELSLEFKEAPDYFKEKNITLYKGKGCSVCGGTGFKGRTALYEFIPNTKELQELTLKSPSSQEVIKLVRKQGSRSLFQDGIEKVRSGVTTIDELLRVVQPE
jgi:type II secretory ATPase GspE/PulE/Tfp pilus assembly ATPase PilB-like protein